MPSQPDRVIHPKYLPTRIPLTTLTVVALVLDRLGAPSWMWGGFVTFAVLALIVQCTKSKSEKWVQPSNVHVEDYE